MTDDYIKKVMLIAEAKYDFDDVVIEAYLDEIQECWYNGFSARRTVEHIAQLIST